MDRPGYAAWRRELETAAAAARGIAGTGPAPALAHEGGRERRDALLARADALLAEDDAVFRARTAAGRVRDWHGRWSRAMERMDEPGAAEALDRLAPLGRRIAADPGLGALDRGHVTTALDGWEARREAERAGAAWLMAWNGDGEDEGAGRSTEAARQGRQLAEDTAMPEALRQGLLDALRAHDEDRAERAAREGRRRQAREAATAARREADEIAFRLRTGSWTRDADEMDRLLAGGDGLAAGRDLSTAERQRLEAALDRERERRAAGLLRAVRALDPAEPWPDALFDRARAAARDPKLDGERRTQLDTAVDNARKRADAHDRFQDWRRDWNAFVATVEDENRPVFADPGCKPHVERARELARDPHVGAGPKETLETTVHRNDVEYPVHVRRCGQLMAQWKDVCADAKARDVSRFDVEDSADIVKEMRALALSPHLTKAQKNTLADIAAESDRHAARRRQQGEAAQLTQHLTQGRSV